MASGLRALPHGTIPAGPGGEDPVEPLGIAGELGAPPQRNRPWQLPGFPRVVAQWKESPKSRTGRR